MTPRYVELTKNLQRAKKKIAALYVTVGTIKEQLDEERRGFLLPCLCGASNRVGDLELIREVHFYSNDGGDNVEKGVKIEYYVCPKCANPFEAPEDAAQFPDGFGSSVKVVHEWDSATRRCYGRVLELLGPSLEREKVAKAKRERERAVEAARAVLKEAGEL